MTPSQLTGKRVRLIGPTFQYSGIFRGESVEHPGYWLLEQAQVGEEPYTFAKVFVAQATVEWIGREEES